MYAKIEKTTQPKRQNGRAEPSRSEEELCFFEWKFFFFFALWVCTFGSRSLILHLAWESCDKIYGAGSGSWN